VIRDAVGVFDVFEHLPPERALADGPQPLLEFGEMAVAGEPGELRLETL
jgi:hypothetical protein